MGNVPAVLNRNFQFMRVYRKGAGFVSREVVVYVLRTKKTGLRIGIAATKKVGCAVERNRARRIVKAAASEILKGADGSFDIVLVCRRATVAAKSTDLLPQLRVALKRAGVLVG